MKISHTSITKQITDYMRRQISSGAWKLGEKIPSESALCQELGSSRASIRAAISQFAALGILRSEQGKGTYLIADDLEARLGSLTSVPQTEFSNIADVLAFRLLIEPQAVLLTGRLSAKQQKALLEELDALQARMLEQVGSPEAFIASDLSFHRAIARTSGNEVLYSALNFVFEHTKERHRQMNELFGFSDGLNYHQKIIEALRQGDLKKAAALMKEHLQQAIDKLTLS